ncbi:hypothetical protein FKW77_003270 [Venturia effusa]|uniref:Flavoprotein domain-containing protein n=1 Tax=Venturia effusa TaxID=50376 RepID=A0A517LL48_9PEZI|nr:hypothetical protein FKW77_003270 [Venturia effusa]
MAPSYRSSSPSREPEVIGPIPRVPPAEVPKIPKAAEDGQLDSSLSLLPGHVLEPHHRLKTGNGNGSHGHRLIKADDLVKMKNWLMQWVDKIPEEHHFNYQAVVGTATNLAIGLLMEKEERQQAEQFEDLKRKAAAAKARLRESADQSTQTTGLDGQFESTQAQAQAQAQPTTQAGADDPPAGTSESHPSLVIISTTSRSQEKTFQFGSLVFCWASDAKRATPGSCLGLRIKDEIDRGDSSATDPSAPSAEVNTQSISTQPVQIDQGSAEPSTITDQSATSADSNTQPTLIQQVQIDQESRELSPTTKEYSPELGAATRRSSAPAELVAATNQPFADSSAATKPSSAELSPATDQSSVQLCPVILQSSPGLSPATKRPSTEPSLVSNPSSAQLSPAKNKFYPELSPATDQPSTEVSLATDQPSAELSLAANQSLTPAEQNTRSTSAQPVQIDQDSTEPVTPLTEVEGKTKGLQKHTKPATTSASTGTDAALEKTVSYLKLIKQLKDFKDSSAPKTPATGKSKQKGRNMNPPAYESLEEAFGHEKHLDDNKAHILLAASGSVATIKIPVIIRELTKLSKTTPPVSIRLIVTNPASGFLAGQAAEQPDYDNLASFPCVDGVYTDDDEWNIPWVRGNKILHIELRRWADLMVVAPLSANTLAKIVGGMSDNLLLSTIRAWDVFGNFDARHTITFMDKTRFFGNRSADLSKLLDENGTVLDDDADADAEKKGKGADLAGQIDRLKIEEGSNTTTKGAKPNGRKRILVAPSMNPAMWNHPVTKKHMDVLHNEWGVGVADGWIEVLGPIDKTVACGDSGVGAMMEATDIVKRIWEAVTPT